MSFYSMAKEITGEVPLTPISLAQTKINEALGEIYDSYDWSFQTIQGAWLCPGQLASNQNQGTYTVTQYSNQVTADAAASLAVNQITGVFVTSLQFRNPSYAIYSIIGVGGNGSVAYASTAAPGSGQTPGNYTVAVTDFGGSGAGGSVLIVVNANGTVTAAPVVLSQGSGYVNPTIVFSHGGTPAAFTVSQFVVLTLDRPWMEPTNGPGQPYMIYQCYFPAPVPNFRKFVEVRDTTNNGYLDYWSMSQADLSVEDAQRTVFDNASFVVSYQVDTRPNSPTLGNMLFELWPQQLSIMPYPFSMKYRGPQLVNQTDTVPYPLTEDLVKRKARQVLYRFKAAQAEEKTPGSGRGWMALSQMEEKAVGPILDDIMAIDINLTNDAISHVNTIPWNNGVPFSNNRGGLNVGGFRI